MIRNADDRENRDRYLPLPLGQVLVTRGAMQAIEETGLPVELVIRGLLIVHARGIWGEVDTEDAKANDWALVHGERIISAYDLPKTGVRVWVITERDRSATTILLPDEY